MAFLAERSAEQGQVALSDIEARLAEAGRARDATSDEAGE
jgi:hypothetical protein